MNNKDQYPSPNSAGYRFENARLRTLNEIRPAWIITNKILLSFIFLGLAIAATAQNIRQQKTDSVGKLMQKYFNEKKPDQIYELTGEAFRNALSMEKFKEVCNNNLFPLGELKQIPLESFDNGVAKYKAAFDHTVFTLLLSLDDKDKIQIFLFKPYADETATKNRSLPSTNTLSNALDRKVDSAVRPYTSMQATVGLSIGILKDGKTYFYGYGETVKGNNQIPNEHTLYEIGSLSKTFTAILLADAANDGLVKLDDPISKYLPDSIPELSYEGIPITLKTLSNHSSGIPRMPNNFQPADNSNPYKDYDDNKLFSFYKNFKPARKPGETYEYSNVAAGTLGVIMEKVERDSYENLFQKKICQPLGMNETKEFLRKDDSGRFAKGYQEDGTPSSAWDFKALAPAGAIRSTAFDLLKYANGNLGAAPGPLLKAMDLTHAITFNDGTVRVGLGWHYIKPGTDDVIFHNGQTGGYHSYLAMNPKKRFAVVILSNCARGTEDAGSAIMKWMEDN
ncbi:MAG TPA: serine hydrolase domain-containing protein [Puia sp.]|nr:serine hydrolase domain-containing protein [Puia sp.]